jgi:hypothetical protein
MSLFRERLLARLALAHAVSPELVNKLLAWKHPGFYRSRMPMCTCPEKDVAPPWKTRDSGRDRGHGPA